MKVKLTGGPWKGAEVKAIEKGQCFTCGRPTYQDEFYRWRHVDPTIDWSEVYPREHPLCTPPTKAGAEG